MQTGFSVETSCSGTDWLQAAGQEPLPSLPDENPLLFDSIFSPCAETGSVSDFVPLPDSMMELTLDYIYRLESIPREKFFSA